MSIKVSYPEVSNILIARFNAYKASVDNDSAMSVVAGTKKAMDEALKAYNASISKAVFSAFLATDKPLDGIAIQGLAPKLVCKTNEAKELCLELVDQPISMSGFLAHAKAEKADVTSAPDYLKRFYALRYHVNARVTKDTGGDMSKFASAFGIVPENVVGAKAPKDRTSNTQLTELLKEFLNSLNSTLTVDNRDLAYMLYTATYKNKSTLGTVAVVAEASFWTIILDIYRKALDARFAYSVEYREAQKKKADASGKAKAAPAAKAEVV